MRPICATFRTSDTTLITDVTGPPPDWTAATNKLTPVFNQGPFFDDRGLVSISGDDILLPPGVWWIEVDLQVECATAAEDVLFAITNRDGTVVVKETDAFTVSNLTGSARINFGVLVHFESNLATPDNGFAVRGVQATAGTTDITLNVQYLGHFEKIRNADEISANLDR